MPSPTSWTSEHDTLLRHLKEEQKLGWKQISAHFENRTPNACQFRWRRLRQSITGSTTTARKSRMKSSSVDHDICNDTSTMKSKIPLSSTTIGAKNSKWTQEEDDILFSRVARGLTPDELSVILCSKTESEIRLRIAHLEANEVKDRNSDYERLSTPSYTTQNQKQHLPSLSSLSMYRSSSTSTVLPPLLLNNPCTTTSSNANTFSRVPSLISNYSASPSPSSPNSSVMSYQTDDSIPSRYTSAVDTSSPCLSISSIIDRDTTKTPFYNTTNINNNRYLTGAQQQHIQIHPNVYYYTPTVNKSLNSGNGTGIVLPPLSNILKSLSSS